MADTCITVIHTTKVKTFNNIFDNKRYNVICIIIITHIDLCIVNAIALLIFYYYYFVLLLLSTFMIALTCNNKNNSKRSIKDNESYSIKSLSKY